MAGLEANHCRVRGFPAQVFKHPVLEGIGLVVQKHYRRDERDKEDSEQSVSRKNDSFPAKAERHDDTKNKLIARNVIKVI